MRYGRRDAWEFLALFLAVFWMFLTMRYPIMGWTIMFGLSFAAWSVLHATLDRRRRIAARARVPAPVGGALTDARARRGPGASADGAPDIVDLGVLFTAIFWIFLTMRYAAAGWTIVFGLAFAGCWAMRFARNRRRRIAARLARA